MTRKIQSFVFSFNRNFEPITHTQPSVVKIEDESSSASEGEDEESILSKSDIPPSPLEGSASVTKLFKTIVLL